MRTPTAALDAGDGRDGAKARLQRVEIEPWAALEQQLHAIDRHLAVDRRQRRVYCPLCHGFTLALPQALGACADALQRCRTHAESGGHCDAARAPKKQRTLADYDYNTQAPSADRCTLK
jgi:hypothetical protein